MSLKYCPPRNQSAKMLDEESIHVIKFDKDLVVSSKLLDLLLVKKVMSPLLPITFSPQPYTLNPKIQVQPPTSETATHIAGGG